MEGVNLILGNNLAGNRVWRAVVPPVMKTVPTLSAEANESEQDFPDVFVSCTATRAMSAEKINIIQNKEELEKVSFDPLANLSLLPSSISHAELIVAQGKDAGLITFIFGCSA